MANAMIKARKSIDILLALSKLGIITRVTGDGIMQFAALIASDMVEIGSYLLLSAGADNQADRFYRVRLTDKGRRLVENWKKGEQEEAVRLV